MPGLAPQQETAGGRARGTRALRGQRVLAQRIVGARFRPLRCIEIETEPWFVDGVDIERAEFVAEFHDVGGAGIDREIDAEALAAAFGEQRRQQFAVIVLGHGLLDEAHIVLLAMRLAAFILGIDHRDARLVVVEMPLDHRQRAFADRAEADHDDRAGDARVNGEFAQNQNSGSQGKMLPRGKNYGNWKGGFGNEAGNRRRVA
jgi:hypothetical protein